MAQNELQQILRDLPDALAPMQGCLPTGAKKGSKITAEEREIFCELYYTKGLSFHRIGELTGRDRVSVVRAVESVEGRDLGEAMQAALRGQSQRRLLSLADRAVNSWEKQLDLADEGKRSNHVPAQDLLKTAGVIQDDKAAGGTRILIQIGSEAPVAVVESDGDTVEGIVVADDD